LGSVQAPRPSSDPEARVMNVVVSEAGAGRLKRAGTGFFGETLDLGVIQDLVRQTRLGASGYVYAVDDRGLPIVNARGWDVPKIPNPSSAAFTQRTLSLTQVTRALASSSTGSTDGRNFRDVKVLTAWATVPTTGWKVFVEQPESAAF